MPQINEQPEPFFRGQTLDQISHENLNKIVNAVVTQLRGGRRVNVSNFGNRVSVDTDKQANPQLPDAALYTCQFVVLEELDDWLLCAPFDQPDDELKWIVQNYDPTLAQDSISKVLVAKPYDLQKTPWDGNSVTYGGWTIDFSYSELGTRTVTLTQVDMEASVPDHWQAGTYSITPGYMQGDIITASRQVTGYQEDDGTPLAWVDMNMAGRHWQAPPITNFPWWEENSTPGASGTVGLADNIHDWIPSPRLGKQPLVVLIQTSGSIITGIRAPANVSENYPIILIPSDTCTNLYIAHACGLSAIGNRINTRIPLNGASLGGYSGTATFIASSQTVSLDGTSIFNNYMGIMSPGYAAPGSILTSPGGGSTYTMNLAALASGDVDTTVCAVVPLAPPNPPWLWTPNTSIDPGLNISDSGPLAGSGGNPPMGNIAYLLIYDFVGITHAGASPGWLMFPLPPSSGWWGWDAFGNFYVAGMLQSPNVSTAGGDLSGIYPNLTVSKILAQNLPGGTPIKGDVLVSDGSSWHLLSVGSDGQVLTADSSKVTGLKWQ